jgi:glycerol-3-phosphate dehydrogenase (NAD(P)+)
MMGCEICRAVKNVLAIAAGASDGFEFGSNGRAALITRSLAKITRLAVKKGADPATMAGRAGVGDLTLTTSSRQPFNFTVGHRLAKGETLDEIMSSMNMVAEGVKTARSVHYMAQSLEVDMPICEQVYEVLCNKKPILEALASLQHRPLRDELDHYDTA